MSSPKKLLNRPKKRTLVRWDDNLDELLLLTIQSVCNKNSVKIPWAEVAKTMGHNVTEGAIVQHLAKLRCRRVASDKDVPPPLRRGGVGSSSTKSSETKRKRHRTPPMEVDEENPGIIPVIDHSSDEDYGVKSDLKTRRKRKQKTDVLPLRDVPIKSEPESENDTGGDDEDLGEFLVPGASFLELPNDRHAVEPSPVPQSKIVVLKYRSRNNHGSLPGPQEDLQQSSAPLHIDQAYDSGPYQHPQTLLQSQNSPAWANQHVVNQHYTAASQPTEAVSYETEYIPVIPYDFEIHNEASSLPSLPALWEWHDTASTHRDPADINGYTQGFFDGQYQFHF